jgi:cytochrome c1
VRGNDWLYTYLRSFYEDPTRPYRVNNKVFPNVGMPNVLVGLQGNQVIGCKQVQIVVDGKKQFDPLTGSPLTHEACDQLTIEIRYPDARAVRREGQEPGDLPGLFGQPGQTGKPAHRYLRVAVPGFLLRVRLLAQA